ncbi:GDSL esterase/lipase [Raphanus sativus]|uniref:GDSL esterase/lipase At3g05180-like n=1 Tax=Raphanus sativus TaxID=3726 RepID=A0A9W3CPA7_RAPSA|nr:GDSL esterase/lipase At3g05180-like [Raphanus sativus]KAJ4871585.1 GDSL esterase/lipase [Raphanus sativus]
METVFPSLLILLSFVAISHTQPLLAASFPISPNFAAVFNFGDSNSDTGEITSGLGFRFLPPNGESFVFKPPSTGRACDGRLIVDILMEAIGRPYLRPYLDSVSTQSYLRGCNFAAAGSTIQKATAASYSPFSFAVQVSQFVTFKYKVLQLIQQDKTLENLPSEDHFKNGLYMFDIGQNDIAGAMYGKTVDQAAAVIPTIINTFKDGINRLYWEGGARNFWIHNTGPIGCLAQMVSLFGKEKSQVDKFGCVIGHNEAAKLFNSQLQGLVTNFTQQYTDANFTYVDIFSIKSDLIQNHSTYGFDQSIMACCGTGGPPLNYNDQVGCGWTGTSPNGTTITTKSCNASSKYVNWDGIHYTEAANRFVSQKILSGKYSQTASS